MMNTFAPQTHVLLLWSSTVKDSGVVVEDKGVVAEDGDVIVKNSGTGTGTYSSVRILVFEAL